MSNETIKAEIFRGMGFTEEHISAYFQALGRSKSDRKAKASRENLVKAREAKKQREDK